MRIVQPFDLSLFLMRKRGRKQARRQHREWRAEQSLSRDRDAIAAAFGGKSRILQLVAGQQLSSGGRAIRKGRVTFVAPANFSLLDNPDGCLVALQKAAADLRTAKIRSVHIDLGNVTNYDVGANAVLDVLVEEVYVAAKTSRRRIAWTGRYPADSKLRRLIKALGVIKRLEVAHEYPQAEVAAKLQAFDARCSNYVRAVRASETDRKSRVTQHFADHLSGCLARIQREFAPGARHLLCRSVSEVLDNAEQHADMVDWTVQGYLDTHGAPWLCEIVILNFGQTIAETFKALPSTGYTRSRVDPYVASHRTKGLFSSGWDEDCLYTLIALQQYVSTKNFADTDTRGNGTYDLIRFFEQMCLECAAGEKVPSVMTLISGRTRIVFDGTYRMKENSVGVNVIAFNAQNDLHQRPDPAYVTSLSSAMFPGTVLSIKFPISARGSNVRASGSSS